MQFDPPINIRTTNELIQIANYIDDWNIEAVEQAKAELVKRGVSQEVQDKKVSEWNIRAEKEWQRELENRKKESFDLISLFFMTIYWPRTILYDWSLKKEGYVKKYKQRLMTITGGIALVIAFLIWGHLNRDERQTELQNEINSSDISEWEQGYYTNEEIVERRQQDIDKAISKIRNNNSNNVSIIILLNSDTIDSDKIKFLKNLDPSTIKDVIFEKHLKPDIQQIIIVKTK